MPQDTTPCVLIVGKIDILAALRLHDFYPLTITANFGEAIEQLEKYMFDYVITDAVLAEEKSGLSLLRQMKRSKITTRTFVCHDSPDCNIQWAGRLQKWILPNWIGANFEFASFHEGTIENCLEGLIRLKCA